MELRGLILLTALACSVTATNEFTDCKKFPEGVTGDVSNAEAGTSLTAVEANGVVTVTLNGDFKQFVITAWEGEKVGTTMAKGEFAVVTTQAAEEMKCDNVDKSAVKNKTPLPTSKVPVEVKWMPKAEFIGKVKFMALVFGDTKRYKLISADAEIKAKADAAGPKKDEPKKESTTAAASYAGLSTWLLIVALGLVAVGGHRLHRPMN